MFRILALGLAAALSLLAPVAAQEAPDPVTDPAAFLVGHWVWDEEALEEKFGPTESDLAIDYRADGTFRMAGTVVMQLGGEPWPVEMLSEGSWRAVTSDAGHILVTVDARDTVTLPAAGPSTEDVVRTHTYEVLDGNTLADAVTGEVMVRS